MKELPTFLKEFASQECRFLIRWIQTRPTRERRFRVLTVSMERWIAVAAMGSVSVKTAREQNLPSAPIVPARVKLCVTVRLPAISTCVYERGLSVIVPFQNAAWPVLVVNLRITRKLTKPYIPMLHPKA